MDFIKTTTGRWVAGGVGVLIVLILLKKKKGSLSKHFR